MFEVLITLIFVPLFVYVDVALWRILFAVTYFLLVLPGLYALISGAPFLPSHNHRILAMLELSGLKKSDVVVDLGCGDGRILRHFAKKGAKKLLGYEFSLPTYVFAKIRCASSPVKIVFADFWKKDLSDANVVICFLMDKAMQRFEREIWPKLKKGTRILSNDFVMKNVKVDKQERRVFLYVKK